MSQIHDCHDVKNFLQSNYEENRKGFDRFAGAQSILLNDDRRREDILSLLPQFCYSSLWLCFRK